jgi:phosphatidylglycerophosphatase A
MSKEAQTGPDSPTAVAPIPFFPRLVATGLFSGYLPGPAGTWGSIVGALIYYALPWTERTIVLLPLIVISFFIGARVSAIVAAVEGHRLSKVSEFAKSRFQPGPHGAADPSIVVIDEIVGMWVSVLLLPKNLLVLLASFCLFRIFDILKPYPAGRLERVRGGWGIMLDDLIAAIYANASVHLLLFFLTLALPGFLLQ